LLKLTIKREKLMADPKPSTADPKPSTVETPAETDEVRAAREAQEKREKEAEFERHAGQEEYDLSGPVKARQVTVETKATGFPEHHLIAKPGWWIVTLDQDASGYDSSYAGHPIEFVLPPEAFHENFKAKKSRKKDTDETEATATTSSASKKETK
jgi:hypothetical protein